MANEVVKKDAEAAVAAPQKTIKGMLANPDTAWGKELAKVLPSPKEVARFMSCALDQLADPKVGRKLAACTLPSFYNAIKKSARSGILPDGVNAYLIPYVNECTLQFSFRGLCDMAIREGIALKFDSDVVRENDVFRWSNGQLVEHTIVDWDEEARGDIVGVWVRAYLPDVDGKYNPDLHVDERMSKAQVDKIRSKSQNPNGVWGEWYEEMMKKSCVKRMFKRMRNTPALAEAIVEDNKEFNLNGMVDRASRVSAADILGGAKAAKKDKDGEVIDIPVAEPEAE
jgi:recombination protein RecT